MEQAPSYDSTGGNGASMCGSFSIAIYSLVQLTFFRISLCWSLQLLTYLRSECMIRIFNFCGKWYMKYQTHFYLLWFWYDYSIWQRYIRGLVSPYPQGPTAKAIILWKLPLSIGCRSDSLITLRRQVFLILTLTIFAHFLLWISDLFCLRSMFYFPVVINYFSNLIRRHPVILFKEQKAWSTEPPNETEN